MVGIPQGEGPLKGEVGWGLDQCMGTASGERTGRGWLALTWEDGRPLQGGSSGDRRTGAGP